jgi:L-asparaginase
MAYTSSALSFLLPSFGKPVVVTGSQIPIARTRSDGRQNLIGALQVAAHSDVQESTLLFGEVLLRGNRATKVDASGLDAFESPRCAPLASMGIDIVVNRALVRRSDGQPRLNAGELGAVAAVRLFPGFSASILANVCRPPLQGLVIEAYGAGNGPSDDHDFLAAIEAATEQDFVVVVVTQCVRGSVSPGAYATGTALMRAGAVPGYDMTCEAALTKLSVLLGMGLDTSTVTAMMQRDIAGELTRSA